jgi:hypothetical protein
VILKDLGVDSLEIENASEVTSDTEGVDILCESILLGVQSLKTPDLPAQNLSLQYWYPGCSEIARLLRQLVTIFSFALHRFDFQSESGVPSS